MSKKQSTSQQKAFHLTRYAYHEAGHAIVGHVIGRCIRDVSIRDDNNSGYHGYCAFDTFAEDLQGLPQWRNGSKNLERITIMYAGTTALRILCEQHGWNYERWRGIDKADFDMIYQWSLDIFAQDEQRQEMQRKCRLQAQDILTSCWQAVEVLATALVKQRWLAGGEAHALIQEALGETDHDWRIACGRQLLHPIEYSRSCL